MKKPTKKAVLLLCAFLLTAAACWFAAQPRYTVDEPFIPPHPAGN